MNPADLLAVAVEEGRDESGFVQSDVAYGAYTGSGIFAGQPPMAGLRALADKYGVLLILDEVVTFRTSTGGMQLIHEVKPDLTALAKIIESRYPIYVGDRLDPK